MNNKVPQPERIEIQGTKSNFVAVPDVLLDPQKGLFTLSGESYMEETLTFYTQIFDWLKAYFHHFNQALDVKFGLTYFNTSSSRAIVNLLCVLKQFQTEGAQINVHWTCRAKDRDMIEEIEDMMEHTGLQIEVIYN